jgi:hypothetical protein
VIHILRLLVNENKMAQPLSGKTSKHFMNEETPDEI